MISKNNTGRWLCDIRIGGRNGKRYKRLFDSKTEAKRFEAWVINERRQDQTWQLTKNDAKDTRTLNELIDLWHSYHGKNLKDEKNRTHQLKVISKILGNPCFCDIDKQIFLNYRNKRTDICANTINHHHAFLNGVFNELVRLDELEYNPIANIKKLKVAEQELSYLDKKDMFLLLDLLEQRSTSAYIIAKICLSTGTRWREAQNLKQEQIRKQRIFLTNTKSGKNRQLPITSELESEILQNLPFTDAYSTFKRVLKDSGITTPKGQSSHILRHSFASHFMMNGGDILTLSKILGHSDVKITMRYAHLSPEHLEKITSLNPLNF